MCAGFSGIPADLHASGQVVESQMELMRNETHEKHATETIQRFTFFSAPSVRTKGVRCPLSPSMYIYTYMGFCVFSTSIYICLLFLCFSTHTHTF